MRRGQLTGVTISNHGTLSSHETGLDVGLISWYEHIFQTTSYLHADSNAYYAETSLSLRLQPDSAFEIFKPTTIPSQPLTLDIT